MTLLKQLIILNKQHNTPLFYLNNKAHEINRVFNLLNIVLSFF